MESAPPANNPPQVLDYGLPSPTRWRERFWLVVRAAIVVLAVIGAARQIRSAWPQLRLYYLERQCLAHPFPPNTVIFSSDSPTAITRNPAIDRLTQTLELVRSYLGRTNWWNDFPVYTGVRKARDGSARFVVVIAQNYLENGRLSSTYFVAFSRPVGLFAQESQLVLTRSRNGIARSDDERSNDKDLQVTIHSGTEDSVDLSCFTIHLDCPDQPLTVDCHLLPDGSVQFNWFELRSFWGEPPALYPF